MYLDISVGVYLHVGGCVLAYLTDVAYMYLGTLTCDCVSLVFGHVPPAG